MVIPYSAQIKIMLINVKNVLELGGLVSYNDKDVPLWENVWSACCDNRWQARSAKKQYRTGIYKIFHFKEEQTMNFGYFDDDNREYVITKPNTPGTLV